jgi:phage shock protein A
MFVMALLERVTTLVRANLNDLIDKAEDPEKMLKQVILDMQNQLMQVKTQVAIAMADQHLLEKKQKETQDKAAEWERKAELAVDKKQDDLARVALERALSYRDLAEGFAEQVADQRVQVDNLKSALLKLQQKLEEAQSKSALLMAQHRRSRVLARASDAHMAMNGEDKAAAFDRMQHKVVRAEAISMAKAELVADNVDDRLARLEKDDKIEQLLAQIKTRKGLLT